MTIQERIQAHEQEAAAYQEKMVPVWSSEDSFFRHLNECNDSDCTICCPVADDDGNYPDDDDLMPEEFTTAAEYVVPELPNLGL